ncbi:hypothetical protein F4779DRAFT_579493 [Xylariaceae sp. FL0662B]|nr:hypothetical protein F4779DRAFT_579493 [Xylariaceae sp. FL0662B]
MGWLSFLSRKSSSTNKLYSNDSSNESDILKVQAYDATIASHPPILGTYPVAGNGQKILEEFRKSHPQFQHIKSSDPDASAPPPLVPRLRAGSIGRPSTAPSAQFLDETFRPKSEYGARAKPKVELREPLKKRHGPYRLPSKISTDHDSVATKSVYSLPSPTFNRNRASSVFTAHSASTGKGFVDLLDAQSSIKPLDFYGRIKATGAKNYGEDVADRNLGEIGGDLDSTKAREPHTKTSSTTITGDDEIDDLPHLPSKRHSMGSGLRAKSLNPDVHSPYPKRTSSLIHSPLAQSQDHVAEGDVRVANKTERTRRKSLPSYVFLSSSSSSTDRPRSSSRVNGAKETDLSDFPDSLQEKARAASQGGFGYDVSSTSSSAKKSSQASRKARDHARTTKDKISSDSSHKRNESERIQIQPGQEIRPRSAKGSSWRRTMSHVSSSSSVKSSLKRHSPQNVQSSSLRALVAESNLPSAGPSSPDKKRDRSSSKVDVESITDLHDLHDLFALLPPVIPAKPSQRSLQKSSISRDQSNNQTRNSSVASPSIKSVKRLEAEDSIPEQTSSLRHWSLTSETAGSAHSSNPFRPQSGHTTNTSVDLTPSVPLSKVIDSGQTSFTPRSNRVASKDREEDLDRASFSYVDEPLSPTRSTVSSTRDESFIDFNMDNVSLDDSFDAPQQPDGEFEKDLVFAGEGYGYAGSQLPGLPGLFDAAVTFEPAVPFDAPGPQRKLAQPRQTRPNDVFKGPFHVAAFHSIPEDIYSSSLPAKYSTHSLPHQPRHRPSHLRAPIFDSSESENDGGFRSDDDEESEEELSFDIPFARSGTGLNNPASRRRYQAAEEPIEEEDLDLDIKTAALLRREAKERMRRSSAPARRSKGKGKAAVVHVPRAGLDDPSGYADIDS